MSAKNLGNLYRWKVKVSITSKRRSKGGFRVTGPDGKVHECPSFKEARNNLTARMRCHQVAPWKIEPVKGGAK